MALTQPPRMTGRFCRLWPYPTVPMRMDRSYSDRDGGLINEQHDGRFFLLHVTPTSHVDQLCHIGLWHLMYPADRLLRTPTSPVRCNQEHGAKSYCRCSGKSAVIRAASRETLHGHRRLVRPEVGGETHTRRDVSDVIQGFY